MQTSHKVLLLALGVSAILLLASLPAADAAGPGGRKLSQWSDWGNTWSGWGWGNGWGNGWRWRNSDPVGSGCWDASTGYRYQHGESRVLPGNCRQRCNWGNWEGVNGCSDWSR